MMRNLVKVRDANFRHFVAKYFCPLFSWNFLCYRNVERIYVEIGLALSISNVLGETCV